MTSKFEKVANLIIEAVWVKDVKRFVDEDIKEDIITYEESESRLIKIGLFTAFFLALGSSILALLFGTNANVYVFLPSGSNQPKSNFPIPMVGLLEREGNGLLKLYTLTKSLALVENWSINLPKQKNTNTYSNLFKWQTFDKYLAYPDQKRLHIISGDMNKNVIMVHSNKSHRTIPNSKIPHTISMTDFVRVGNIFWIFGGLRNKKHDFGIESDWDIISNNTKTLIWSMTKQKWLEGPMLPQGFFGGCGIALNRSTVMLLVHFKNVEVCIHAWIYDFQAQKWQLQNCFDDNLSQLLKQTNLDQSGLFFSCGHTYGGKNHNLNILMWIYDSCVSSNSGTLVLFEENRKGKIINHSSPSNINFFTLRGMIFVLSLDWDNNINLLSLASNNTKLVPRQSSLDFGLKDLIEWSDRRYNSVRFDIMSLPFYK